MENGKCFCPLGQKSQLLRPECLSDIVDENEQLCRIFTASMKTARRDPSGLARTRERDEMENGK
jgi:hypothetical protein